MCSACGVAAPQRCFKALNVPLAMSKHPDLAGNSHQCKASGSSFGPSALLMHNLLVCKNCSSLKKCLHQYITLDCNPWLQAHVSAAAHTCKTGPKKQPKVHLTGRHTAIRTGITTCVVFRQRKRGCLRSVRACVQPACAETRGAVCSQWWLSDSVHSYSDCKAQRQLRVQQSAVSRLRNKTLPVMMPLISRRAPHSSRSSCLTECCLPLQPWTA